MKNTIRCCISCILPCGALDVVRIVHSNGRVEEISGSVKASEIMKAHPKHVLKKPSSDPLDDGMVPKIVIVPPDAKLQRGKIYFLLPVPPTPEKTRSSKSPSTTNKKGRDGLGSQNNNNNNNTHSGRQHRHSRSMTSKANKNNNKISMANVLISDQYLNEILSEKLSMQRDRRRGRVGVWRPHLESISETPNDS